MEENEELKEAVEKLDTLSADERMRRIAELREKAILDEKAIYARGIEVGEEQGELNKSKEIAKNMLKEKISIEIIVIPVKLHILNSTFTFMEGSVHKFTGCLTI